VRWLRLDACLWTHPERAPAWRDWLALEYDVGLCGCRILTVGRVCLTWMGDECLAADEREAP
jgi:hypothetical protein